MGRAWRWIGCLGVVLFVYFQAGTSFAYRLSGGEPEPEGWPLDEEWVRRMAEVGLVPIPETDRSRRALEQTRRTFGPELERRGFKIGDPIFIRVFKKSQLHFSELPGDLPREIPQFRFSDGALELWDSSEPPIAKFSLDVGRVELWMQKESGRFELIRSYPVCTYSGTLGTKTKQGDYQSPEGFYSVTRLNPSSDFELSFDLGYPNAYDRHRQRTGSAIMIHGECVSAGCFAMRSQIREIYSLVAEAVRNGQAHIGIHVFPFPLEPKNLELVRGHSAARFWSELIDGYQYFETHRRPPRIEVRGGQYVVRPAALNSAINPRAAVAR